MRLIAWVVRAALFLLLFGLALNNQHDVVVRGLFGTEWRSPMIVVVLASFIAGVALTLFALGLRRLPVASRQAAPAASPSRSPGGPQSSGNAQTRGPAGSLPSDIPALGAADGPPRDGP